MGNKDKIKVVKKLPSDLQVNDRVVVNNSDPYVVAKIHKECCGYMIDFFGGKSVGCGEKVLITVEKN